MLRRLLTRKWAPVTVLAVLALAMVGVTLAQREGGGGSGLLGTAVGDTFTADSNPKTVRLGNGDIVLTARKTADKKAWMATYSAATAVWGDWSEVGAVGSGTAIMDTWTDSEWQMVFALKGDGNVNYRQYKNKVWGAWANLGTAGGGQVGDPAAAGARPGCTQWAMMAIRGKDTNFWLQSWWPNASNPFSGWWSVEPPPFPSGAGPALATKECDSMTLFARDRGGLIYGRTFQNGDWTTNWQLWGGPKSVALAAPDGAASATATADGQGFYVAATFNDAAVWLRENRAGHSADWQSLGSPSGGAKGAPAITTQANGDLDVFVRDSAGVLWQKHMVGGAWKDWWKVTVGGSAEVFVTDVTSVAGSSSVACPAGYTKLPDNTVNGMSTNYVFVCVQYGTKANALNWISVTYDRSVPNCWTGTDKRGVDLRKGAGGLYDFLCVTQRMSGRSAIRDVGIHSFDYTTGSDTIEGCKGPKWPLPANPWRGGGWTSVDNYLAGTSNMGPGPINGGGLFDKKPDNWMFLCYMN